MVSFLPATFSSTSVGSARPFLSTATACPSLLNGSRVISRRDGPESDCSFVVSTQLPYRAHVFYSTVYRACSLPLPANSVQNLNGEQQSSSAAAVSPHRSRVWIVAPVIVGLVLFVLSAWICCLRPWLRKVRQRQAVRGRDVRPQRILVIAAPDRVPNERHVHGRETHRFYNYRRQEWTSVRIGDARNNNEDRDLPAQSPRRTLQVINPDTLEQRPEQRFQPPLNHRRRNNHHPAGPPPTYPQPSHSSRVHPPLVPPPPIHLRRTRTPHTRTSPTHQSPVLHRSTQLSPARDSSTQRPPGQVPRVPRFAHGSPSRQPEIQRRPNYPPMFIPPQHSSPALPPRVHLPPSPRASSTPSSVQRSAWNNIRAERRREELHRPSIASLAVERPASPEPPTSSSDFSANTLVGSGASVPKVQRNRTGMEQMEVDDTTEFSEEFEGNENGRDIIQWILETLGVFQMGRLIWRPGRR